MKAVRKKILIVSAFAEPQSTGGTLEQTLIREAQKAGCTILHSNLYATHFNAVSFPRDFQPRKDAGYLSLDQEQRHAYVNGTLPAQIKAEQQKLEKADAVVFLCPVYWGSPPAIMKGWLEQVLTPVFAYDRGKTFANGPMAGKQALFAVQTGGRMGAATDAEAQTMVAGYFEPLCRQALAYCGFDVKPTLALISPGQMDPNARTKFLMDSTHTILNRLGVEPPPPAPAPSPNP